MFATARSAPSSPLRVLFAAASLLALAATPLAAEEPAEVTSLDASDLDGLFDCRDLRADVTRLACYDAAVDALMEGRSLEGAPRRGAAATTRPAPEPSPKPLVPQDLIEVDEAAVADCELLGDISGKSGWGGRREQRALEGAKRSAKREAMKLGATHVVFDDFENSTSMKFSRLYGRAYRCGGGSSGAGDTE